LTLIFQDSWTSGKGCPGGFAVGDLLQ